MTLDMKLGPQTIEWGFVDRWAVANYLADGRLVTIGWLRRPDTLHGRFHYTCSVSSYLCQIPVLHFRWCVATALPNNNNIDDASTLC